MLLAALGIPVYGARELAKIDDAYEKARFTGVWMGTNLLFAFAAYLLSAGSLWLFHLEPIVRKFGIIWGARLVFSGASCYWIFQAHEKMGLVGLRDFLKGLLFCGVVISFIRRADQLLNVAWLSFGTVLVGELFLLILLFSGFLGFVPKLSFHRQENAGSLRHTARIGFTLLMVQVYYRTDSVILELIKGERYVGLYTAIYQLIFVGESIAVLYFVSILPKISSFWQNNKGKLSNLLEFSMSVFTTMGCLLGIMGLLFSKEIVSIVYGEGYISSHTTLAILIWSMVMTYTALTPSYFLIGTQYQRECSHATMIAALANLALNFPLIIYYGVHGAALATVASKVMEFVYVYKKASERIALNWKKDKALRLVLTVAVTLGIGAMIRRYVGTYGNTSLLLSVAAVCISYFGVILVLKVISLKELKQSIEFIES